MKKDGRQRCFTSNKRNMCYYYQNTVSDKELEKTFKSLIKNNNLFEKGNYNGFSHPYTAVILDSQPKEISAAQWGLLPSWVESEKEFRKKTNLLNAKIETVEKLRSFKNSVEKRCLVLATSFNEWKHLENGKIKVKHKIFVPGNKPFAMAGLYSEFEDKITFTILTTEANELMATIHNSKKRMPVILRREEEKLWLGGEKLEIYHNRKEVELIAQPLDDMPLELF